MEDVSVAAKLRSLMPKWGLIARDIVLLTSAGAEVSYSAEDIARTYNLTSVEFVELVQLPAFAELVKTEAARVKSLGAQAGHRLRAEMLASDLQERLYMRASIGDMDDKQAIQLLTILLRTAGLEAPVQETAGASAMPSINIAFNVPALPNNRKLAHIVDLPQTNVVQVLE